MDRPLRSKLPELFGDPRDESFLVVIEVPKEFSLTCGGLPVKHIRCNSQMEPHLSAALREIALKGFAGLIETFDGCYCVRESRSDDRPSVHSWGLAIDINAATNKLGTKGCMSVEIIGILEDNGFYWGGLFHRPDPMHFQWVTED